ncbi:MAG: hypothetical protein AMXMBFR33_47750 [Candidatus Xenobia bacterium]
MNALREELEAACRALGAEPVEPLLTLSRDERLMSPVALKLGLDPEALASRLSVPATVEAGYLFPEPRYELAIGPLEGLDHRWESFFRMAGFLGLETEDEVPWHELTHPDEQHLVRYTAWRAAGLGDPERLRTLLDDYYCRHDLLRSRARVALCRAALRLIHVQ